MSFCQRCGCSDWHPEARTCTLAACGLRATPPIVADDAIDQHAGEHQPDFARGVSDLVPVHSGGYAA